jgi:PAS domain S-box-containing protein
MAGTASAERASLLAELRLDDARELLDALAALARGVSRQAGGVPAAVVLDDGVLRARIAATAAAWPEGPSITARLQLDGRDIGTLQLIAANPVPEEVLTDAAGVATALLEARLREVRIAASQERERIAAAAGSDWLWETDVDGVLTWVSDSVQEHTGWPASVEIGMHSMNLNRPPPGREERESWDRYRARRAERLPFRDGIGERDSAHGTMLVAMSGRPRFDAQGRFAGYRGAARDVTGEVAQRHAAQRVREQLLQAMDAVHAGLMISGPDGRIVAANAAWHRQTGRFARPDEGTWEALIRAMAAAGAYPDAAGREDAFVQWRLGLASPDARPHTLRFGEQILLVSDQRLPDGSTVHLSIDVTERERSERQRVEAEARLGAVLKAVPDLWFVVDRDDRYLLCSDESHPSLVEPFAHQVGKPFGASLDAPYDRLALEVVRRARSSGEMQRLEYEAVTRDGRACVFEARAAPMTDGQVLYLTRDLTDLRRLERELLLLQRAVEADAAMPVVVTDARRPEEPIVYVNSAFERLTGYPRAEALGRPGRFLLDPDQPQPALPALEAALAAHQPCTALLSCRRRDGSSFLNEVSIVPIRDAQGEVVQHLSMLTDVTERVRDAERLRISEELYRSVAATISDGLLVAGPDGQVIACNPSAAETLGAEAARFTGHRLSELGYRMHDGQGRPFTPEDHPVRRVLRGGPPARELPLVLHRPDGSLRRVLLTARALRTTADAPALSCLVSFRDITEQHAAAQALEAAETRWRFALEGAGDGVWDYDEDTGQAFYSPRWKQMLGYADAEIGTSLKEWSGRIHPEDHKAVMRTISDYREGRIAEYQTEHRLRHRDGHWIWILDRGKIVERRADGSPRRVVGIHTDITRHKEAEQALLDKQAAELASRAKSEFLSRMSHEMRTPLNAVIGFSQLLRLHPGGDPDKVAEYAEHILRASEHLLGLVNEVLDLQRVEEGRAALQPRAIELAPFLDATLELLRPAAQAQGVALSSQVPPRHAVLADERCLRQVLMNMVSNAVKYNRPGGWVVVTLLDAPPGRCAIAIEDTGSGLTDEQLARLFQPFERLGHESSGIEGSGLGLVITRSLIEQMDGTVTLSSVPGAGTLARIELPAAAVPEPAPAAMPVSPPAAASPVASEARPDRKSTRLNSSHRLTSRMPSSA